MNEAQLIKTIKAHIAKGEKAAEKSEQHYIAAGLHLKELKATHTGTWNEWEELLKTRVGIGKSRASELMQIADGRKTVESVRADTAKRVAKHDKQTSPLANGEDAERCPHSIFDSGFHDEDGSPIWICRGCGGWSVKLCDHHPAVAFRHDPDCPALQA